MKRYDTYKDSGVQWIGEIPSHWEISKVKYIGKYINGYAFKPSDWTSQGKPIIRIQDLTGTNSGEMNYYDGEIKPIYNITKGDILISWAATLSAYIWDSEDAWLNQHIFKAIPYSTIDKNFFYHLMRISMFYMNNDNKHGIMMEHVTASVFDNFNIALPPLVEQKAIAAWLDVKCGEIDKMIGAQQRRIELLQELRQSIITRAVTRGINPDAPLRHSGIDWIGEIPSHWEIGRMKFTGKFDNGLTYSPNDVVDDESGFLVLRSTNIQDNKLAFDDCVYVNSTPKELLVKNGDIIICSRNGSANLVGKCAIVDKDIEQMTFGAFMMRYRPYINSKYAFYMFQSATSYYKGLFSTTTINQLTKGIVSIMKAVVPPIAEQQEIVDYIERETAKVDAAIGKAERQIALLQELRQSVITEVVTGKRKVC